MRKTLTVAAASLLIGVSLGSGALSAQAVVYYGSYYNSSGSGISYKDRSWVQDSPSSGGVTVTRVTAGGSPGGYMGASVALVRNGSICASSGLGTNSAGVTSYTRSAGGYCGYGNYASQGLVYIYTGAPYATHNSIPSPILVH